MNSIKILSKLTKFPLLNPIQKFILLVMYDNHFSPSETKSMTTSQLSALNICKTTALYSNLKKLQEHGLIDLFNKQYFITPKFLHEMGKIDWEDLTIRETKKVGYIKDFTIERLEEFINGEDILITNTMKQDLFNTLKISSNISVSLKDWFFENYGSTDGAVYYNRFLQKNQVD
jgi:uncharacterized protein (UPF0332 family)